MPRFARYALNALTLLSLLLCAATAALWARSYWRFDSVYVSTQSPGDCDACSFTFHAGGGRFTAYRHATYPDSRDAAFAVSFHTVAAAESRFGPPDAYGGSFGTALAWQRRCTGSRLTVFAIAAGRPTSPVGPGDDEPPAEEVRRRGVFEFLVASPYWLPAGGFALLPAWRGAGALRRRGRRGAGLCRRCGYHLRATPDRCPECGRSTTGGA